MMCLTNQRLRCFIALDGMIHLFWSMITLVLYFEFRIIRVISTEDGWSFFEGISEGGLICYIIG